MGPRGQGWDTWVRPEWRDGEEAMSRPGGGLFQAEGTRSPAECRLQAQHRSWAKGQEDGHSTSHVCFKEYHFYNTAPSTPFLPLEENHNLKTLFRYRVPHGLSQLRCKGSGNDYDKDYFLQGAHGAPYSWDAYFHEGGDAGLQVTKLCSLPWAGLPQASFPGLPTMTLTPSVGGDGRPKNQVYGSTVVLALGFHFAAILLVCFFFVADS